MATNISCPACGAAVTIEATSEWTEPEFPRFVLGIPVYKGEFRRSGPSYIPGVKRDNSKHRYATSTTELYVTGNTLTEIKSGIERVRTYGK